MVVEHFSMVALSTAAESESAEESKVLSRLMLASNSTLMSSWSCFDWLLLLLGICLQIFNSSWYMLIMVESTPSSFSISTENFGESCSCSVDFGSVAGSGTKSIHITYFTKFVYNLADSHPALRQAGHKTSAYLSPNYSLNRPLASPSGFEGIIGTEIHAHFKP